MCYLSQNMHKIFHHNIASSFKVIVNNVYKKYFSSACTSKTDVVRKNFYWINPTHFEVLSYVYSRSFFSCYDVLLQLKVYSRNWNHDHKSLSTVWIKVVVHDLERHLSVHVLVEQLNMHQFFFTNSIMVKDLSVLIYGISA